jgi:two-component system chemotaxis response regulator CheY
VDGYMIKPFRSQILQDKIQKVLATSALGKNKQVVLVDDDNDARETVMDYIKLIGFKDVMSFSDGISALKYVNDNAAKIGLIISDWEMPKMTGLDFLRSCKAEKSLTDIPFLMITSQSSIERMKVMQAARANVDQYMLKPFNVADFHKRIEEVLEKAKTFPEVRRLVGEGTEHMENGRTNNAVSKFEEVLKIQPDNDVALRNMADIIAKEKDYQAALPYYKKAIEANPTYARTYLKLASAYEHLGWVDRALALLQTANEQVGFNAELHFALGKLYHKKGLLEQARSEFEKTLEMQVDHAEAKLLLEMLTLHRKGPVE